MTIAPWFMWIFRSNPVSAGFCFIFSTSFAIRLQTSTVLASLSLTTVIIMAFLPFTRAAK